jgi:delta 1-pyrroline-5-carboxylate dehydrogenase
MVSANCLDEILLPMDQDKKVRRHELDLDAEAFAALEEARAMQPGPERTAAMKKAGILRNAADLHGIAFARRGRPPKI